jgi:hypothetical protein
VNCRLGIKEAESEQAVRHLCHKWRADYGYSDTPAETLSFSQFYAWLEKDYWSYLQFRTTTSVRYDVEMWFDHEFGLTGRR